jgi:hypothetical protein
MIEMRQLHPQFVGEVAGVVSAPNLEPKTVR